MNDAGLIEVWLRPVVGHHYILGVDTGDGVGRDRSVAAILHRDSYSVDALLVSDAVRPFEFAGAVEQLGYAYNTALIIPEADARGRAVINLLLERGYWNLWRRQAEDKAIRDATDRIGFKTTLANKHVLIDELRHSLPALRIWSEEFVSELGTFITDVSESGRELLRAQSGCHDDILIAVALANWAHRILPRGMKWAKEARKPETEEQWADEDLARASKKPVGAVMNETW